MNKLEIGSGIALTLLDENLNPINFKLALFARKMWSDSIEYEFGYISDDGRYARSCYSGGSTGFGVSWRYDVKNRIPKEYTLKTTDIKEMMEIANQEEAKRQDAAENEKKEKKEKVLRINALPEEVEVEHPDLKDICIFKRSEASYNPAYSRKIQSGQYRLHYKNIAQGKMIWIQEYVTKSGSLQAKQFAKDNSKFKNDPKTYLKALLDQSKKLNEIVKNA